MRFAHCTVDCLHCPLTDLDEKLIQSAPIDARPSGMDFDDFHSRFRPRCSRLCPTLGAICEKSGEREADHKARSGLPFPSLEIDSSTLQPMDLLVSPWEYAPVQKYLLSVGTQFCVVVGHERLPRLLAAGYDVQRLARLIRHSNYRRQILPTFPSDMYYCGHDVDLLLL